MINVFRLHQRKLWLVIAIVTIVSFAFFYNPAKLKDLGANAVFTAYDKTLTQADIDREARKYALAIDLQQLELIGGLAGMAQDENQMVSEFVWNLIVLQHESKALGIEPTSEQVSKRIETIPSFQTNGRFDWAKYSKFVEEKLGPRGFTVQQLEDVVRDSIRYELLREVITAPVSVGKAEIEEAGRVMQKVDVQSVSFPLDAARSAVTIAEEEISSLYAQNQQALARPETRVVEYVQFALPADSKPAEGKEKVEALQKLVTAASSFAAQAQSGKFAEAASASGLKVETTPEFDRTGRTQTEASADSPSLAEIAQAAFALTDAAPVSEPIQVGDKFYVAKLVTINPVRPMTLEEARPLIETQVRSMRAGEILRQNADAAIAKIREAMAGGKSFADAAAALGLKVDTANGVTPTGAAPDQRAIMRATILMEPGQVSALVPGMTGGYVVYLAARAPLDAAEFARQKGQIEPGLLEGKQEMLFVTWLTNARQAAKIERVVHEQ